MRWNWKGTAAVLAVARFVRLRKTGSDYYDRNERYLAASKGVNYEVGIKARAEHETAGTDGHHARPQRQMAKRHLQGRRIHRCPDPPVQLRHAQCIRPLERDRQDERAPQRQQPVG